MPGMGGMGGMGGAGADLEAMKQQQAIKYVRQHHDRSQHLILAHKLTLYHRCKQPWNPAPASSSCPA
jgi:hypothetical protein